MSEVIIAEKTSNNASAIVVVRVRRDAKERVRELQAVNVVKLPNGLNFKQQTVICKQMCALYNAKAIVIDINGLITSSLTWKHVLKIPLIAGNSLVDNQQRS